MLSNSPSSSAKRERKVRRILTELINQQKRFSESEELTKENIEEINQEIESAVPIVTHLTASRLPKIQGLGQTANKLRRRNLHELADLVLGIDTNKVTEKDVVDLSIRIDSLLNKSSDPHSIEPYINSFIEKINHREEEQSRQLEQKIQRETQARQAAECENQKLRKRLEALKRKRTEKTKEHRSPSSDNENAMDVDRPDDQHASDQHADDQHPLNIEPSEPLVFSSAAKKRKRKTEEGNNLMSNKKSRTLGNPNKQKKYNPRCK